VKVAVVTTSDKGETPTKPTKLMYQVSKEVRIKGDRHDTPRQRGHEVRKKRNARMEQKQKRRAFDRRMTNRVKNNIQSENPRYLSRNERRQCRWFEWKNEGVALTGGKVYARKKSQHHSFETGR